MEAKEFRIDNYVFSEMCEDIIQLSALLKSQDLNIKPIPLTEEWLLKFGFERLSQIPQYFINDFHIYKTKDFFKVYGLGFDVEIKHVHQLQNLYFYLTGEELTLKQ